MPKVIWAYFNATDLDGIEELISSNGAACYDQKMVATEEVPFVSRELSSYTICIDERMCMKYTPCVEMNDYVQCGVFRLMASTTEAVELFSALKKYIRKNFTYSKRNACYYGPGFYNEWLENKWYCKLPISLESQQVDFQSADLDEIFQDVIQLGFDIKPNVIKLSLMDDVSMPHDSFVIYYDHDEVIRTITRKRFVRYELDSKCIFVYKDNKKGVVSFLLDRRISDKTSSKLIKLFEKLKTDKRAI